MQGRQSRQTFLALSLRLYINAGRVLRIDNQFQYGAFAGVKLGRSFWSIGVCWAVGGNVSRTVVLLV